jgi:hypothetical protein
VLDGKRYKEANPSNNYCCCCCCCCCVQVCVLDGKRYKEANPSNNSLGFEALSPCILDKPLLKWEAGSETAVVALHMEVSLTSSATVTPFVLFCKQSGASCKKNKMRNATDDSQ